MSNIYDLPFSGFKVGHAEDTSVVTGTTACVFDEPAVAAVHIMGASPGTRETELLDPEYAVAKVDAIVLSGGSAFGLDAAGGCQAKLKEEGRGIFIDPVSIPIVPSAILFDMRNEGNKDWGRFSPYRELGYEATSQASNRVALGSAGAAFGASTANTKGGFGMASSRFAGGHILAMVALNAVGSPLIGNTNHYWAAPFEENEEFGGLGFPDPWPADAKVGRLKSGQLVAGANTTLAIVVTDLSLTPSQAKRVSITAHDGFARALYPVHTMADGDLIFTASTGQIKFDEDKLLELSVIAANLTTRAIAVAAYQAERGAP